jgi:microcystin-dependent protein
MSSEDKGVLNPPVPVKKTYNELIALGFLLVVLFAIMLYYINQPISGTIVMWAGSVIPGGWVLCDGTRGTPDLRGRFILGSGQGVGLTNRTIGQTGGAETHVLTTNEIPSHTHVGTVDSSGNHTHSITDPGHTHTQTTINDDYNNSGSNPPGFTGDSAGSVTWSNINSSVTGITINNGGDHTHTFTSNSTGGGLAHNNMPPFYVLAFIMKL